MPTFTSTCHSAPILPRSGCSCVFLRSYLKVRYFEDNINVCFPFCVGKIQWFMRSVCVLGRKFWGERAKSFSNHIFGRQSKSSQVGRTSTHRGGGGGRRRLSPSWERNPISQVWRMAPCFKESSVLSVHHLRPFGAWKVKWRRRTQRVRHLLTHVQQRKIDRWIKHKNAKLFDTSFGSTFPPVFREHEPAHDALHHTVHPHHHGEKMHIAKWQLSVCVSERGSDAGSRLGAERLGKKVFCGIRRGEERRGEERRRGEAREEEKGDFGFVIFHGMLRTAWTCLCWFFCTW